MYFIGIDASTGYARLAAADGDLRMVGKHTSRIGKNIKESISKLLYEFNKMTNTVLDSCAGLCIGVRAEDINGYETVFEELAFGFPVSVVCEQVLLIAAATNGGAGVVVYSSAVSGGAALSEDGELFTMGEYPKPVDDGSSAYSMGVAALKAAVLNADGRGEKTALTETVLEYMKLPVGDLIKGGIHKLDDAQISELGLSVKYAAAKGDNTAVEIETQAAVSLAQIGNSLIKRAALEAPVVCMAGSVFLTNPNIQKIFSELITAKHKTAVVQPLKDKPEMGALYLANKLRKE